jgi:two-component system CheB/CheR fusion protein
LIKSSDIGPVFLNRGLRITLFSPAARTNFNLIPADIGRSLSDITTRLVDNTLIHDAETVLDSLQTVEREVQTIDQHVYMMRVLPYRTVEDRISGVVVTFVDITSRKQAEEALRASEQRLQRAIQVETVGIIFFKPDGAITTANNAFLRMSGYNQEDLASGSVHWDVETLPPFVPDVPRTVGGAITPGHTAPYEKEYTRRDGSRWWGLCSGKRISEDESVEFIIDITSRKEAEEDLRQSEERFRLLVDGTKDYALFLMDVERRIIHWNTGAERIFG